MGTQEDIFEEFFEKWQSDDRNISQSSFILLTQLTKKRPPKKRRYTKGSRTREVTA